MDMFEPHPHAQVRLLGGNTREGWSPDGGTEQHPSPSRSSVWFSLSSVETFRGEQVVSQQVIRLPPMRCMRFLTHAFCQQEQRSS